MPMEAPLKTLVKLLGGFVSDKEKLLLGMWIVFSVLTARLLYLFYIDGMVWTAPLGSLCLTLGLCFRHLQPLVNRAAAKRVFTLLFYVLIFVSGVFLLIGFVH